MTDVGVRTAKSKRSAFHRLACGAAICTALTVVSAQAQPVSWPKLTADDLAAIHRTILENHPGPVDPENPGFRRWLENGYRQAMRMARAARGRADYERALRYYANGFADGHLAVGWDPAPRSWPGFLTYTQDGRTRVGTVSTGTSAIVGDELVSCDGTVASKLLDRWIYPFFANPGLPQLRTAASRGLFAPGVDDRARQFRSCIFRRNGKPVTAKLRWSEIAAGDFTARLNLTPPIVERTELGVREVDGVWFVSIPTFQWNADRIAQYRTFLADLTDKLPRLYAAPIVVIDVRLNGGGYSDLATQAASILFGKEQVDAVAKSFDWTLDFRASPANLAGLREGAKRARAVGENETADSREADARAVEEALRKGQSLARRADPPTSNGALVTPSPFQGKVYFLTAQGGCGSSCLDFADVVLRMPGVIHVGGPTYGDAVYTDIPPDRTLLPSGLSKLVYPWKVYRNRVRANNQWYTPKFAWPGGPMTSESVARWVKTL